MSQAIIIFQWEPELLTLVRQTLRKLAGTGAESIRGLKSLRAGGSVQVAGVQMLNAATNNILHSRRAARQSVLAEHLRIYQIVELNGVQGVFFKLPSGFFSFSPQKSFQNCFTLSAFIRFISLCEIVKLFPPGAFVWKESFF